MILSDREISMEIDSGRLKFDPEIENSQISPSSVDLRLSNQFKVFKPQPQGVETIIDLTLTHNLEETIKPYGDSITVLDGQSLVLHPGDFVLAYTREFVEMPNYLAARVEGRSSYARLGISVHQTASTIHATFAGQIRLEISRTGTLACRLHPGARICQMVIERLASPAEGNLRSQFQSRREA